MTRTGALGVVIHTRRSEPVRWRAGNRRQHGSELRPDTGRVRGQEVPAGNRPGEVITFIEAYGAYQALRAAGVHPS